MTVTQQQQSSAAKPAPHVPTLTAKCGLGRVGWGRQTLLSPYLPLSLSPFLFRAKDGEGGIGEEWHLTSVYTSLLSMARLSGHFPTWLLAKALRLPLSCWCIYPAPSFGPAHLLLSSIVAGLVVV